MKHAVIIESADEGRRLIVSDMGATVIVELHARAGEDFAVTFIEISKQDAAELAAALGEMLPRKTRPPPTPPIRVPPPIESEGG